MQKKFQLLCHKACKNLIVLRTNKMAYAAAAVAPPCFLTVRSMASRPRQGPKSKNEFTRNRSGRSPDQNSNTSTTSTTGFGNKKREPQWQCVQNCGACCKLDKGPTFPSPEEIFEDPSDVQVSFQFHIFLFFLYFLMIE